MRWLLVVGLLGACGFEVDVPIETSPDAQDNPPTPEPGPDPIPLACPQGYESVHPLTSKYRRITTARSFGAQHADCADDGPGAHLVVLDSPYEAGAIGVKYGAVDMWVGAVQRASQGVPSMGWSTITGDPIAAGSLWESSEPNDDDNVENGQQQFAIMQGGPMNDKTDQPHPAICECDGRAIDPEVAKLIPSW